MLRLAPKFYEVAKRIIEITDGCVIVAHNASFDYRILRTEFRRLGYEYNRQTLCTVELSKKLLPEAQSYSLGKLVRSLGIPIADRHRASGDDVATLKLFKLLLTKDHEKTIVKDHIKSGAADGVSPKLYDIIENQPTTMRIFYLHNVKGEIIYIGKASNIIENQPTSMGIFYVHNEKGEIIYIGKSSNIRKKVGQLFTGTSKICKRIQNEVFTVTYEETGNELIAQLKEREELLVNKPVLNV